MPLVAEKNAPTTSTPTQEPFITDESRTTFSAKAFEKPSDPFLRTMASQSWPGLRIFSLSDMSDLHTLLLGHITDSLQMQKSGLDHFSCHFDIVTDSL